MQRWQRFTKSERAKEGVVDTAYRHGGLGDVERLYWIMSAAKVDFGQRTIVFALALLGQDFDLGKRLTGIANSERLDLVGNRSAPGWKRIQQWSFDLFPLRFRVWLLEVFDRLVVNKP